MLTTLSSKLYLGIDAGGTHTEAVITDETGFVLGRSTLSYGTNPHNTSLQTTYDVLLKAVAGAREDMQFKHPDRKIDRDFDIVCVGMAGYDTEGDKQMVTGFVSTLPESEIGNGQKPWRFVDGGYGRKLLRGGAKRQRSAGGWLGLYTRRPRFRLRNWARNFAPGDARIRRSRR